MSEKEMTIEEQNAHDLEVVRAWIKGSLERDEKEEAEALNEALDEALDEAFSPKEWLEQ